MTAGLGRVLYVTGKAAAHTKIGFAKQPVPVCNIAVAGFTPSARVVVNLVAEVYKARNPVNPHPGNRLFILHV
jgi:hypothetical protein